MPSKQELLEENDDLRAALEEIQDKISDLLGDEESEEDSENSDD